ncbi:hypothetical protein [Klebsiella pneumoniae ISC21]|nr:hypothetical protein [Klebsiella pneumoniae ISC21]
MIAKQSYVGKEGDEERGRREKTEFFFIFDFFHIKQLFLLKPLG